MMAFQLRGNVLGLLAASLLAGCAASPEAGQQTAPITVQEAEPEVKKTASVDETAMLPLLGYMQLLLRMSPPELLRERSMLGSIPQTPATQLRMAMLLGQARGPTDLGRALALLDGVLKSGERAASSLHPLARTLSSQYSERLRLQTQNEKLIQQLNESLRKGLELQEKLDALTNIERTLPVGPKSGENSTGSPR